MTVTPARNNSCSMPTPTPLLVPVTVATLPSSTEVVGASRWRSAIEVNPNASAAPAAVPMPTTPRCAATWLDVTGSACSDAAWNTSQLPMKFLGIRKVTFRYERQHQMGDIAAHWSLTHRTERAHRLPRCNLNWALGTS